MRRVFQLRAVRLTVAALACGLLALAGWGQRGGFGFPQRSAPQDEFEMEAKRQEGEFHFIRMEYTDLPQFHRGFGRSSRDGMGEGWWIVDWPAADNHFTRGIGTTDAHRYRRSTALPHYRSERVRLSVDLCHAGRLVGSDRRRNGAHARISAAWRFSGDGRFLGAGVLGDLPLHHGPVLPGHDITDIEESDPVMHVLLRYRGEGPHVHSGVAPLACGTGWADGGGAASG